MKFFGCAVKWVFGGRELEEIEIERVLLGRREKRRERERERRRDREGQDSTRRIGERSEKEK